MLDIKRAGRLIGLAIATWVAVGGWVVAVPGVDAASCSKHSHQVTLSNGTVSPGSGVAGSAFTFSVRLTDNAGCAPTSVTLTIAGVGSYVLGSGGGRTSTGVTFSGTLILAAAGTRSYSYRATSGSGAGLQTVTFTAVSPAAVVVTAPPPPTPRPSPTPAPTPKPTPKPTPLPTPAATSKPTARPTTKPTTTSAPGAKPGSKSPKPTARPKPAGSPVPGGGQPSGSPSSTDGPLTAGGGSLSGGSGGDDGRGGSNSNGPLGGDRNTLTLGLAMVGMTGLGLIGLVVVGRRRRGEDDREPVPVTDEAPTRLGPAPALVLLSPDTRPDEIGIPRWRRPSLREARARDVRPSYDAPPAPILFHGDAPAAAERRIVRYRLVRISSVPDEIMGDEVGRLDRGDEVELVRSAGEYCLVRTPFGVEGWIHRMTLSALDQPASLGEAAQ